MTPPKTKIALQEARVRMTLYPTARRVVLAVSANKSARTVAAAERPTGEVASDDSKE
jgi:hypothetical protein